MAHDLQLGHLGQGRGTPPPEPLGYARERLAGQGRLGRRPAAGAGLLEDQHGLGGVSRGP